MRKLICIIVAFMLMLIVIGCFATMSPEQRKEVYDMRKGVGNAAFVGDHYPRDEFGNITWVPPY